MSKKAKGPVLHYISPIYWTHKSLLYKYRQNNTHQHIVYGGIIMANKGRSDQGLFGTVHHYDEHGRKTGRSEPKLFGGYTNYDNRGNKIGH